MTKINIQNLRNLTTGILHTDIDCVYQDIARITGYNVYTHQIPSAMVALRPWLREHYADERLWDGKYDAQHVGEVDLVQMSNEDKQAFELRYCLEPNPLDRGQDA